MVQNIRPKMAPFDKQMEEDDDVNMRRWLCNVISTPASVINR